MFRLHALPSLMNEMKSARLNNLVIYDLKLNYSTVEVGK